MKRDDDDVGEARRQCEEDAHTRMLDERILKKELKIKYLEHKVETLKMMKTWIEKM